MKKIILDSNFTLHQKIMLIATFIFSFVIGSLSLIYVVFMLLNLTESTENFEAADYFSLFLFPVSIFILLLLLSKNGLIVNKSNLYSAKFIFGKYWFKQKKDLTNITDITIFSTKAAHKFAFISVINPDKQYSVNQNKIFLLNEKHTVKRLLIQTNDIKIANEAIIQITKILGLKYMKYNPRFNTKRRKR